MSVLLLLLLGWTEEEEDDRIGGLAHVSSGLFCGGKWDITLEGPLVVVVVVVKGTWEEGGLGKSSLLSSSNKTQLVLNEKI